MNGDRVRIAFAMDCSDREIMSYVATTKGITAEMVKDLMAESIEYRFGIVDKVPHESSGLPITVPLIPLMKLSVLPG